MKSSGFRRLVTDKKYRHRRMLDVLAVLVGGFIWAVGLNMFVVVNPIAPNGLTGIAAVINHFTGFPVGMTTILLNVPLFFLSWKTLNLRFAVSSAVVMAATSVIIDLSSLFLPAYTEDTLTAAIFGGVLSGIGLGIIYMRGMATGGVDVIARMLEKPFPFISYGTMLIILDCIVILIATVAYGNYTVALYSVIVTYLSGFINDQLLLGGDRGKQVSVITDGKEDELASAIMEKCGRGVTKIVARGAYTNREKGMLMVVCRPYEIPRIKSLVHQIDPRAFVIVSDVTEVLGEGFEKDTDDKGDA